MTQKLSKELYVAYPRIFDDGEEYSVPFEHGDGWYNLVNSLCMKIDTVLKDNPSIVFHVAQIKEKFGTLRFYYYIEYDKEDIDDTALQKIDMYIDEAEKESKVTCENCGKSGKLNFSGWLSVSCDDCLKKNSKKLDTSLIT